MQKQSIDEISKNILISVIIPVFKVQKYINACVDSVINQTYKNLEIILVDDGSPDKCPLICDEYAAKDSRVHVIHKQNGGLSDARNVGINESTGEYIIFLDSDDRLAKDNVIQNLVNFLIQTNSEIIYCPNVKRNNEDEFDNKCEMILNDISSVNPMELLNIVTKNKLFLTAWTFVVSRILILNYSLFFSKGLIYEDMEWFPRLLCSQENLIISIFPKPFYVYNQNPTSLTSTYSQRNFDSMNTILSGFGEKLRESPDNLFLRTWFNINIYNLLAYFEKDCINNSDFYKMNINAIKQTYRNNYKFLNKRNKILYIFIQLNPKLFFVLRKCVKRVLGK